MKNQVRAIVAVIKEIAGERKPEVAIVLGSGLGGLADEIENPVIISYNALAGFPQSTVKGHAGRLVIGKLNGVEVICMQGRAHYYEGNSADKIALPIRVFQKYGIKKILLTNAAGSMRKDMPPGSLMVLEDHINISGFNPLIGPNYDEAGTRFPDMTYAYDPEMRKLLLETAKEKEIELFKGVYLMASGPNFETPAEIRTFRSIGGDAIGMSTAPETLIAVHCGIKVAGVSVITNYGAGMVEKRQSHEETIEQANKAADKLKVIIRGFLRKI
ncbi:MAG: purine-nucleoside phosphorylase [Alphaproteobacteria bacterium]|nr:purine-nucleoside phosphorylase [Alphaproteobacteria bacterium]